MTITSMPFFMRYKQYYKEVKEEGINEITRLPLIHYEMIKSAPAAVKESFIQFCEKRNRKPVFYDDPLVEYHLEEQNEIMVANDAPKSYVVQVVSYFVADAIRCMANKQETSILDIAEKLFDCYGYEFTELSHGQGIGWSKDGGQTCILEEDDLFEVLKQTEELLQDEVKLDFSKYAHQKVGLPYAVDFTVQRMPKKIARIIINSSSGFSFRQNAYHDEMILTKNTVRYKYDPVDRTKDNPAIKWSYQLSEQSYQMMYSALIERMPRLLRWDLNPFVKDCSTVTFTVIYSDKSRRKNVFNMLKEEYDELEDIFFILQKLVPYSMNTRSLLFR